MVVNPKEDKEQPDVTPDDTDKGEEKKPRTTSTVTPGNSNVPKTNDMVNTSLWMEMMAAAVAVIGIVWKKRRA